MTQSTLAGVVIAITGAGQGIGLGIARACARQGARLVLGDIDEKSVKAAAESLRADGAEVHALTVDVRSADDNAALVAAAVSRFGRLDVMIANAGVIQVKPLMALDADDWARTMSVNVIGAFLSLQAAARQMLGQVPLAPGRPSGKLINVASIAGRYGAGPVSAVMADYRASKAALISLTQSAAYTFAPTLTVNAICPGVVDTDMWRRIDQEWTDLRGVEHGEAWKQRVAGVPMGRAQTPADVAGLAVFLASEAADYLTGQAINIDGGLVMS